MDHLGGVHGELHRRRMPAVLVANMGRAVARLEKMVRTASGGGAALLFDLSLACDCRALDRPAPARQSARTHGPDAGVAGVLCCLLCRSHWRRDSDGQGHRAARAPLARPGVSETSSAGAYSCFCCLNLRPATSILPELGSPCRISLSWPAVDIFSPRRFRPWHWALSLCWARRR